MTAGPSSSPAISSAGSPPRTKTVTTASSARPPRAKVRCPLRLSSLTLDQDRPEILSPPERPQGLVHAAHHCPGGRERANQAEARLTPLLCAAAPTPAAPVHRRRTLLCYQQVTPRRQRHPHAAGAASRAWHPSRCSPSRCSLFATSASAPPRTPSRRKASDAQPLGSPETRCRRRKTTDVDGHRFTAFATDAKRGHLADLELRHRRRARCEDRIRGAKDADLRNFPLKGFAQNQLWCEIVDLACELLAWMQLLALTGTVRRWEPKRLRLFAASGPVGTRRPPPAAKAHRAVALGRGDHHRNHPPAGPYVRLTSRNTYTTRKEKPPGTAEPRPPGGTARAAGHGHTLKISAPQATAS
jgi:hypothetical protein